MFGFVKGLLSSEKIIDSGISAIDKMALTEEEKKELQIKYVEISMPMNRTRRLITLFVLPIWAFHVGIGTALFLTEAANFSDFMAYMNTNITLPFSVIIGFYFFNERYGNSLRTK